MLNRIPLGGTSRIMTDSNGKAEAIRHLFLQEILPQSATSAIAAASIGFDEQSMGIGKAQRQFAFAPAGDVIDGKGRRVGRLTDIEGATIVVQVIDPIRNGAPDGLRGEVMLIEQFSATPPTALP